jgi:CheY-like chemotaxis protein
LTHDVHVPEADGADADPPAPILIVDDREGGLVALRAALEPLGQPIISARSGDEALGVLLREQVALILLDVYMPGIDGFETATLIKQRPKTREVPIIFLTADGDALEHGQMALGYSSGAVDFLVKPFDPRILRSKVSVFVELHRSAEQLRRQVAELSASRAALARAQRISRLAHFDIDVRSGRVTWSDNANELLGFPPDEQLHPEELFPFWQAMVAGHDGAHPFHVQTQHRCPDGKDAALLVSAEYSRDRSGALAAVSGTIQDVTDQYETRRALAEATTKLREEHEVVSLLQQSMLPGAVPRPPGLDIAVRYLPADVGIGGDWYDVTWRRDGLVMLVIGDVAGHGIGAAATMNELRIAARAFAMRDASPARVLEELNRYIEAMDSRTLATALIILLDPATGKGVAASAGHLPPILDDGVPTLLTLDAGPPLGAGRGGSREVDFELPPGGRLLMYTDGLVEVRTQPIDGRLAMLTGAIDGTTSTADDLAEQVIATMLPDGQRRDDVAVLAVQRGELPGLVMSAPADPSRLSTLRATLQHWLESVGATREETSDLVLACGELLANVCVHAHPMATGQMELRAMCDHGVVRLDVIDHGAWRADRERGGGRGLSIVRATVDELTIEKTEGGTQATVRRRLECADCEATDDDAAGVRRGVG